MCRSPTASYPLVMHLPNGQTVPLLPSPVQMTSVISVSDPFLKSYQLKRLLGLVSLLLSSSLHVSCPLPGVTPAQLARPVSTVPNIPGIPGPPVGGASSGSSSPSGYSMHSDGKMVRVTINDTYLRGFFLFVFCLNGGRPSHLSPACPLVPSHKLG